MNSSKVLLPLIILALSGAASGFIFRETSDDSKLESDPALRMLAFEHAINDAILHLPVGRARRAAQRHCGNKLLTFIISTCGAPCSPQEGEDIATKCCGGSCDDSYIKKTCCPMQ